MSKSIFLPISSVIGKLDLSVKMNVHIIQERKIKGLSNDKSLSLWQVKSTSVVGLLQSLVKLRRDVIAIILTVANSDDLAMVPLDRVLIRVLCAELFDAAGHASWKINCFSNGAGEEREGGEEA
jgi:hypothetical protein